MKEHLRQRKQRVAPFIPQKEEDGVFWPLMRHDSLLQQILRRRSKESVIREAEEEKHL